MSNERIKTLSKYIGENLKRIRADKHMSQADVAFEIGVSTTQYQKYEKGKDRVSGGTLKFLSELYDVSMDDFFIDPATWNNGIADIAGLHEGEVLIAQLAQ